MFLLLVVSCLSVHMYVYLNCLSVCIPPVYLHLLSVCPFLYESLGFVYLL